MAGRQHSLDALLSKETLLTVQYMSICETNMGLGKKNLASKSYLLLDGERKVQVEYLAQSPKDVLAGNFLMG